jgi:hypothetical protein
MSFSPVTNQRCLTLECLGASVSYLTRPKTSKFAPKVDEDILLGYGSNEHAYCVFNKTMGRVEVTIDVTFDESNDS